MRLKAIPHQAAEFIADHPLAIGGVVLAGVVGFMLLQPRAQAAEGSPADSGSQDMFGYGMPVVYAQSSGMLDGGAGGGIGSDGSASGSDPLAMMALQLQGKKNDQDFQLNLATLKAQSDMLAANTAVAMETIEASRFSFLTGIAQAFVSIPAKSGNDFHSLFGSISDNNGNIINLDLSSVLIDAGNKKAGKAVSNISQLLASQASYINATRSVPYVPQSTTAPKAGIAPGSLPSGLPTLPASVPAYASGSSGNVTGNSGGTSSRSFSNEQLQ
jgi:hypothetical protein